MKYSYSGSKIYSVDLMIAYVNLNKVESETIDTPNINLDYKGWTDSNGNKYSPNDVLKNPKKYKDDYELITNANLKYPILVIDKFVADGIHRITNAIINGKKKMKAVFFTINEAKQFIIPRAVHDRNDGHEMIELYVCRFMKKC